MSHRGSIIILAWVVIFIGFTDSKSETIQEEPIIHLTNDFSFKLSIPELVKNGKIIIFGSDDPKAVLAKGEGPIGRGGCPLCHKFLAEQKADRSIPLMKNSGIYPEAWNHKSPIELRSRLRVKEERYRTFANMHSKGEKNSGIKPHAESGGEYLIESLYCPNCYVPERHGLMGTNDTVSPMPIINKSPILLNDFEIVAVVAYLQTMDTPGDYSKVTALEDWEQYFGKKLKIIPSLLETDKISLKPREFWFGNRITLPNDSPEEIIIKTGCLKCHEIPGISAAKGQMGVAAPLLLLDMKTKAEKRLLSKAYQAAVRSGQATATTPKEYVIESILRHNVFPRDVTLDHPFSRTSQLDEVFTVNGLDRLADFLLTIGENEKKKNNLIHPNEKKSDALTFITREPLPLEISPALLSHPHLSATKYDGKAVWFAGFWNGLILLRMDLSERKWETFYFNKIDICCRRTISFEKDRVVFAQADTVAVIFEKESKSWKVLKEFDSDYYTGYAEHEKIKGISRPGGNVSGAEFEQKTIHYGGSQYIGLGKTLYKIQNNQVVESFLLPQLLTETLLKYKPNVLYSHFNNNSSFPVADSFITIKQEFGPMVLKGNRLWFGITFQGAQGVGGLAFFDLKKKRFGFLRAPFLVNCSIFQMEVDGNDFLLRTASGYQGDPRTCPPGLVKYNINTGAYRLYNPPLNSYNSSVILSFVTTEKTIWATTPYGIVEFDGPKKAWNFWAINKAKIIKSDTKVLTGATVKGSFNILGRVEKGEIYDLWWTKATRSKDGSFFQIKSPFTTTGWIANGNFKNNKFARKRNQSDSRMLASTIYLNPEREDPFAYFLAADFDVLDKKESFSHVSTKQGWINSDSARLIVNLFDHIQGERIEEGTWPEKQKDIISFMDNTAVFEEKETVKIREKAEVLEEKICNLKVNQGKSGNPCIVSINNFGRFKMDFLNLVRIGDGTGFGGRDAQFILSAGRPGVNGDEFFAFSSPATLFSGGNGKILEKGKKYMMSNHQYSIIVEILDFKMSRVFGSLREGMDAFESIKLKVKAVKFLSVQ